MNWFRNPRFYADGLPGVGLLILRLFIGYAMAMHGLPKMSSPFGWMGPQAPVPGILQALGAAGEFFGGMGLFFGALTSIAALGVMSTMFVATLAKIGMGTGPHYFIPPQGADPNSSYELSVVYFFFALTLFLTGPGLLSVDAFLAKYVLTPKKAPAPATPPSTPVVKTS